MPHVIICHVQRDGLAGSRQPATRQQGVICGFQAPGTHGGCSRRAGDLESSSDKHMPVPGAGGWGRKGPSIQLGLPGAKEKQRERRQELQAREKPSHLAWREKGGPGKRWLQCRPRPANLFPGRENILRAPGCLRLRQPGFA